VVLYQSAEINAILGKRREAVSFLKQAIAHGFLTINYLTFGQETFGALYNLRDDPEFQAVRNALQKRVEDLRKQY
jgi:hypothetical protein